MWRVPRLGIWKERGPSGRLQGNGGDCQAAAGSQRREEQGKGKAKSCKKKRKIFGKFLKKNGAESGENATNLSIKRIK